VERFAIDEDVAVVVILELNESGLVSEKAEGKKSLTKTE